MVMIFSELSLKVTLKPIKKNCLDICDRAMFYYTLLTTISTQKCARLLTGTLANLGMAVCPSERPGKRR